VKVAFEALIHQINSRSLVCGEKQTVLSLKMQDVNVSDEILNALNTLHRADSTVMVVLMDKQDNEILT